MYLDNKEIRVHFKTCCIIFVLLHTKCLSFLNWPLLPAWCRCRGLFLHLITLRHTTISRTPLKEGSARRRDPHLNNTQHSKERDFHDPGGIRTRNPNKRAAAELPLRPRGHWDRPKYNLVNNFIFFSQNNEATRVFHEPRTEI
jgi:hypothetical protein